MNITELKEKMEKGISLWSEKMPEYNSKRGYEVAKSALAEAIRTYGKFNWPKGGVSYHFVKLKTPTPKDTPGIFDANVVEIRLDYWGCIWGYLENGSGSGSEHPSPNTLRLFMDKIEEAISE